MNEALLVLSLSVVLSIVIVAAIRHRCRVEVNRVLVEEAGDIGRVFMVACDERLKRMVREHFDGKTEEPKE